MPEGKLSGIKNRTVKTTQDSSQRQQIINN